MGEAQTKCETLTEENKNHGGYSCTIVANESGNFNKVVETRCGTQSYETREEVIAQEGVSVQPRGVEACSPNKDLTYLDPNRGIVVEGMTCASTEQIEVADEKSHNYYGYCKNDSGHKRDAWRVRKANFEGCINNGGDQI